MYTKNSAGISRWARWGMAALGLAIGGLAGCGGGTTTTEVKMPESDRPDIDEAAALRGTLSVPGGSDFNYSSFRSGQTGAGRGESKRSGSAGALCSAECQKNGSAWGEFQFGYTFDNKTGRALAAVVKLKLKVTEANTLKSDIAPDAPRAPTATNSLVFFIKDSIGVEQKSANLLASTVVNGPSSTGNQLELVFDAKFEADRGYYLIIAGRSDVQAEGAESLSASVEISDVSLDITWKPATAAEGEAVDAPAVAGAGDEGAE